MGIHSSYLKRYVSDKTLLLSQVGCLAESQQGGPVGPEVYKRLREVAAQIHGMLRVKPSWGQCPLLCWRFPQTYLLESWQEWGSEYLRSALP